MNDQEWQEFRRDYLSRNNVYIPDTQEAREQFDGNSVEIPVPIREDRSDVFDVKPRQEIKIQEEPAQLPADPKKRMLEAMKRKRNVP